MVAARTFVKGKNFEFTTKKDLTPEEQQAVIKTDHRLFKGDKERRRNYKGAVFITVDGPHFKRTYFYK